ncbi:MAG: hypothetical protein ABL308_02230 [Oceanicaulis sp.]
MKTNKEYKRRFPWFSASLGIVAIASVATLFVSGQLNAGQGEFGLFVTRLAERITSAEADPTGVNRHTVRLGDAGQEDGLIVSGFPSYASAQLPLVRDQRADVIRLVLRGEQDVSARAVTALRVNVNGDRVMERVLSPGRREFNWVFDLTEELADQPGAQVSFQLLGDLPEELCHNDRSMGAVIQFAPDSGIEIELAGPIDSVRDVLALTPRDIIVAMDEGDEWFEMASRLGADFARQGYRVEMVDLTRARAIAEPGLKGLFLAASPEALRRAGFNPVRERAEAGASLWRRAGVTMVAVTDPLRFETARFLTSELSTIARADSVNPVIFERRDPDATMYPLTRFGLDTSIQRIADNREWRFDYLLSELPGGRLPEALALDLRLPEGPEGFTNIAHIELNGDFIDSRRLQSGQDNRFAVALPPQRQGLSNEIAVVLQRHRDDGGCAVSRQRYPVQLSADSGLTFARGAGAGGFTAVPAAFSDGLVVRLPDTLAGEERLVAARVTAESLAYFVPEGAPLRFEFVAAENGEGPEVDRPFLAVNAIPVNAEAPLRVYADRLVMDGAGPGRNADVRELQNLALIQVARATIGEERGAPIFAPGLVVNAIDDAPQILGANFGQNFVAIVHSDGEAVSPDRASMAGLDSILRR